ncbi:hypothetical protein ABW19_dt0209698 [Dactylella cylindrospora]|nr:hypothetical protein ABW19_dt0209698 [Dactylella cylindrospora]
MPRPYQRSEYRHLPNIFQQIRTQHIKHARKAFPQSFLHAEFIMPVSLLQKFEISCKPILAFPMLNLGFHEREVRGKRNSLVVVEEDLVIGFAFYEIYSLIWHGSVEICEGFTE